MRWENLTVESGSVPADATLFGADAVTTRTRLPRVPRDHRVPGASRMPFEWTVNPGRRCTHACSYVTA
jgi:hypothetical protein